MTMLNFEVLAEAHRADLEAEAARARAGLAARIDGAGRRQRVEPRAVFEALGDARLARAAQVLAGGVLGGLRITVLNRLQDLGALLG